MIDLAKYFAWIEEHLGHLSDAELSCQCTAVCLQMRAAFPELRIKSGHPILADDSSPGAHTWLMTADERHIIDPTERQYHCEVVEYAADIHDDGDLEEES